MTKNPDFHKILIIGPGPVMIGQGSELDDAATQTCLALKQEGYQVVMVNSNPATVTTDKTIADIVYIEPLTLQFLAQIIRRELPDAIIPMVSGQVGLDLIVKLLDSGILDELQVTLLGVSVDALQKIRNHALLKQLMQELSLPTPKSKTVTSWPAAQTFVKQEMFPLFIHSELSVAGKGNYLVQNGRYLEHIVKNALAVSPVHQVTLEQSMAGQKEVHLNLLRDSDGNVIVISSSEDLEPIGIHTGDSISVTPVQTLSDHLFQQMRTDAIKLLNKLMIVGNASVRFAVDTVQQTYHIMDIILGASRASVFAEKATGYPIAWVAAKLMVGMRLDQVDLPILKGCKAALEPTLDYVAVKMPRFSTKQFENSTRHLDTQMKATGEAIGVGNNLLAALVHAIQGLEITRIAPISTEVSHLSDAELTATLQRPQDDHWEYLLEALRRNWSLAQLEQVTQIDRFFLAKLAQLLTLLTQLPTQPRDVTTFLTAKRYGLSNELIAQAWQMSFPALQAWQDKKKIKPAFKPIEPSAGLWPLSDDVTYYDAYGAVDENHPVTQPCVLVLGAGPVYIGQGGELDNELTHALLALRKAGYQPILINNNPNAVSINWHWHAKTYLMPLTLENIMAVINYEHPLGVLTQFAGKNGEWLIPDLLRQGINVLGINATAFDKMHSNRKNQLLDQLKIMHPQRTRVTDYLQLTSVVHQIGFPVFVQPVDRNVSHITTVLHDDDDLREYLRWRSNDWQPVNISRYLVGIECETEAISDGTNVIIPGIIEHIERSGVLANDSMAVYPPQRLSHKARITIKQYTTRLAQALQYRGILHMRFIIVNDEVFLIKTMMRASKSLPFLSKATNMPLTALAIQALLTPTQFSDNKNDFDKKQTNLISIKAPVFSYIRLSADDTPLSAPSVKATGEVMGNDVTLEKALYKAFSASQMPLPDHGVVLLTVADRDKMAAVKLAKRFRALGYQLWATPGTAASLQKEVPVKMVQKVHHPKSQLLHDIASDKIQIIINTLSIKHESILDSLRIREVAVEHNIPLLTSLETTDALLRVLESRAFMTRPR